MDSASNLEASDSLLIIFTHASAGVKHLRLTDALYSYHSHSSQDTYPAIFGTHNLKVNFWQWIKNFNLFIRQIFEWLQRSFLRDIATLYYQKWLRCRTQRIYHQLSILFDQHLEQPKKVVLVSTHYGLSHQLAAVKNRLEREKNIRIYLVVQVPDASFHPIWLVPKADLILVPDNETKHKLAVYRAQKKIRPINIDVCPYPFHQDFLTNLSRDEFRLRRKQLNPKYEAKLNIALPISGGIVDFQYFVNLFEYLEQQPLKFQLSLAARFNRAARDFIFNFINKNYVQIYPSRTDHQLVNDYLRLYLSEIIGLEISQPNEQAFKVLLDPVQRGGSIMLFSQPIGQRERDNLSFIRRWNFIPTEVEQEQLWNLAQQQQPIAQDLLTKARSWRGLQLPTDPQQAAQFIVWFYLQQGFLQMLRYLPDLEQNKREINDQGAAIFWQKLQNLVGEDLNL